MDGATYARVVAMIQRDLQREEPVYVLCLRPGTVRALEIEGLNRGGKHAFGYRLIVVDGGEEEGLIRVNT